MFHFGQHSEECLAFLKVTWLCTAGHRLMFTGHVSTIQMSGGKERKQNNSMPGHAEGAQAFCTPSKAWLLG